jgi:HD-GYP domain-containing protein (c-di-GMP phosphodiesterase class II)
MLDGSGYPAHLQSDAIPWETRLLTILDIYDALTAEDRPYKPPLPPEKAFAILRDMASNGKIDAEILESFYASGAWKHEA